MGRKFFWIIWRKWIKRKNKKWELIEAAQQDVIIEKQAKNECYAIKKI